MLSDTTTFEALLEGIRADFIAELPNRCIVLETALFTLNKNPNDTETFQRLFREVHSLKGSGGTQGIGIITAICHQLENLIILAETGQFDNTILKDCLALCDLIKLVAELYEDKNTDFSSVEEALEKLKVKSLNNRKKVLIVESSKLMAGMFQQLLTNDAVQLKLIDDGMVALNCLLYDKYDLVVLGGEIKTLNAKALIAALRESKSINVKTRVILVSSNIGQNFPYQDSVIFIKKDQSMAENLKSNTSSLLN